MFNFYQLLLTFVCNCRVVVHHYSLSKPVTLLVEAWLSGTDFLDCKVLSLDVTSGGVVHVHLSD